jgi:hypothetical protein
MAGSCKYDEEPAGSSSTDSVQLSTNSKNVNVVGEDIDTIQRNTKALLDASKEVGLEVNPEKTKYMLV